VLDVAGVDHPALDVVFEQAAPVSSRVAAAHCCAAARWEPAVPAFGSVNLTALSHFRW
jgi:hypothetical protein